MSPSHNDVIKWKHFPRYWPFVRGIHRSPVNSPRKGQWRGALMFTLICTRINGWVNNCEAGDLRRNRAHYDVIVMRGIMGCYRIIQTRAHIVNTCIFMLHRILNRVSTRFDTFSPLFTHWCLNWQSFFILHWTHKWKLQPNMHVYTMRIIE